MKGCIGLVVGILLIGAVINIITDNANKFFITNYNHGTFWEQINGIFHPKSKVDYLREYKGDTRFNSTAQVYLNTGFKILDRKILSQGDDYYIPQETFKHTYSFFMSQPCSVKVKASPSQTLLPPSREDLWEPYFFYSEKLDIRNGEWTRDKNGHIELGYYRCTDIRVRALNRVTEIVVFIKDEPIKKKRRR